MMAVDRRLPRVVATCVTVTLLVRPGGLAGRQEIEPRPGRHVQATAADVALEVPLSGPRQGFLVAPNDSSPRAADYFAVSAGALVVGAAAGGILSVIGSQLGDPGAQENATGVVGFIVLGAVGYAGGCIFGANTVGRWRGLQDPGRSTLWGGLIGLLVGTAIGFAEPGDNLDGVYLPAALLGPPIGAVVGFFRGQRASRTREEP